MKKKFFFNINLVVVSSHFKNPVAILLEFLPQVLFLLLLFGYMVVLIIMKWFMYYTTNGT